MLKKIAIIFACVFLFCGCSKNKSQHVTGNPDIAGVYTEMYSPEFWINEDMDKEMLTKNEISLLNHKLQDGTAAQLLDLQSYPDTISKGELIEKLNTYVIPDVPRYTGVDGNAPVTKEYYNKIRANRNMNSVQESNRVVPAVIVNETSLRDFPDDAPSYEEAGNMDIDLFHESKMKVWDNCIILHTSLDKNWYFIQTKSFRGWIKAVDAAICEKKDWQKYGVMDFALVTGNRVMLDADPYDRNLSRKEMLMGTKLPLVQNNNEVNRVSTLSSYQVMIPVRGMDGKLEVKTGRIPKNSDISIGYLPFTEENIIRQSFKMLGERYGWGGSLHARDCSSYIRDVYLCFGIELPRNSAAQGAINTAESLDLSYLDDSKKEEAIKTCHVGSILEMQGHVMMYLGEYEGKIYGIHAVYAFGESGKGGVDGRKNISCVTVSDLTVTRKDGSTFLSNLRNAVAFD